MDKFRVGQKVRYKGLKKNTQNNGKIVYIEAPKQPLISPEGEVYLGYLTSDGWGVEEQYLEPVYDGDEKSSWDECVWKPLNVPFPT